MTPTILFIIFAVLLLLAIYGIWRFWSGLIAVSRAESRYEQRMAALNERQANRYTDEQLTHPANDDEAWRIMVQRGKRATRRERYSGSLSNRSRDRRRS
jgi:membrane protein implicated in regulation of membrane protease activity